MRIINKYIGKEIFKFTVIVMLSLLGIDLFFYFVNELKYIGTGNYTLSEALIFIALTIPSKIYVLFPWSILLGGLLGLGNLARHYELIMLRVAGMSIARIAIVVLRANIFLIILIILIGEIIAPFSQKLAQNKKMLALSSGQNIQTIYGTWIRNNNEFIRIGSIMPKGQLKEIIRYQFDNNLFLTSISHAKTAILTTDGWLLEEIKTTEFSKDNNHVCTISTINKKSQLVPYLLDINILQATKVKHLERLSLVSLWKIMHSRKSQDLNIIEYERAFWFKIFQPCAILVMSLLSVPCALGPLRSSSVGFKIFIGIIIGFAFHSLNSIFGSLTSVIALSPILAAILPSVIFTIIGFSIAKFTR